MNLQQLAGAWRLKSLEFTGADGAVFRPLGENPGGCVVISPHGYLTLAFIAGERPPLSTDDVFRVEETELARAAAGYVSFGGPCEVSPDAITVQVEYSIFPNWVGAPQTRNYLLDGDRLTLRTQGPRMFGGTERNGEARLERVI